MPGRLRPNYDYKHVKDTPYKLENQTKLKTYQGTLENTNTSRG